LVNSPKVGGSAPALTVAAARDYILAVMLRERSDWSRRLPRALVIPSVMKLRTLADVRALIGHLPAASRDKATWRYVADRLAAAARGADPLDVAVPLQMVLSMEGVECRPL
jgi:hypothetical protein